ncbi:3-hydroxybutyryl-CoA dehydratase-like protein [Zopfochytrium polystomum]|nr:3-hydroxybutyryl-CoA dehydratase-like protein [Zopfochytrium polystomum]
MIRTAIRRATAPGGLYCHSHLLPQWHRHWRLMPSSPLSSNAADPSSPQYNLLTITRDADAAGQLTGVVTLALNSPKNLNAMTVDMGSEFQSAVADLSSDPNVRCLILTGQGKAFSAGGDLAFLRERTKSTGTTNTKIMRDFYNRFLSIRNVPFPTIAAINGHAIGAGACVTLACDIRIMSDSGKIGLNFVRIGLSPGMGGTFFLPRVTNPQVAARMILTGDLLSAKEAQQLGLVLETHSPEAIHGRALELARRIASASPVAVRGAVRSLRVGMDDGLNQALSREADLQAIAYASPDMEEGLAAIVAKRDPVFGSPI